MKNITLALLVASALSAEVWHCSTIGARDESLELGFATHEINSTITINKGIATVKSGDSDKITFVKEKTSLDGFTHYRHPKTKELLNTNRYMDERRLFLVHDMDVAYMIRDCKRVY